MNATTMTLEEIRLVGLRALYRDLGAVGLVRFLQQFETGHGDYTTERHRWLDEYTVQDVVQQIRERQRADEQ
jgi:hypothetical protein